MTLRQFFDDHSILYYDLNKILALLKQVAEYYKAPFEVVVKESTHEGEPVILNGKEYDLCEYKTVPEMAFDLAGIKEHEFEHRSIGYEAEFAAMAWVEGDRLELATEWQFDH